jgi:hypothetical protein
MNRRIIVDMYLPSIVGGTYHRVLELHSEHTAEAICQAIDWLETQGFQLNEVEHLTIQSRVAEHGEFMTYDAPGRRSADFVKFPNEVADHALAS